VAALLALFVRFVDPEATRAPRHLVASAADLAMVRATTSSFTRFSCCACEWWLGGRPAGVAQLVGAGLTCAGVVGYRRAGRMLGEHLTPLIAPPSPRRSSNAGRIGASAHPMYLAELAMAFGVPLLLDARWTLVVSVLRARGRAADPRRRAGACGPTPAYPEYATRTFRLIPHVY
jgi:protein-S-isoprenylcysteine O-methyltransferase Ste14